MKTLKTLMVESFMTYLSDRNMRIFADVSWDILDKLNGFVDLERVSDAVTLNFSVAAVGAFNISDDNMIAFECAFHGKKTTCYVPTASIVSVYDPESKVGMPFIPDHDCQVELFEAKQYSVKVASVIKKPVEKTSNGNVVTMKFGK